VLAPRSATTYLSPNIPILHTYRSSVYVGLVALNEQRFYILTALASGPLHGYAIAEEIARVSDGSHAPRPGSLYHAIDKLIEQQLLELDREEVVDGRLRRYYRLTETGVLRLTDEATRRAASAQVALRRLHPGLGTAFQALA